MTHSCDPRVVVGAFSDSERERKSKRKKGREREKSYKGACDHRKRKRANTGIGSMREGKKEEKARERGPIRHTHPHTHKFSCGSMSKSHGRLLFNQKLTSRCRVIWD